MDANEINVTKTATDVIVEPPDKHYLTDADSADEDEANINRLSGNQ